MCDTATTEWSSRHCIEHQIDLLLNDLSRFNFALSNRSLIFRPVEQFGWPSGVSGRTWQEFFCGLMMQGRPFGIRAYVAKPRLFGRFRLNRRLRLMREKLAEHGFNQDQASIVLCNANVINTKKYVLLVNDASLNAPHRQNDHESP